MLWSKFCFQPCVAWVVVVVVFGCLCCNWVAYADGGNILGLTLGNFFF